jgi:hypothetical protein
MTSAAAAFDRRPARLPRYRLQPRQRETGHHVFERDGMKIPLDAEVAWTNARRAQTVLAWHDPDMPSCAAVWR